MMRGVCVLLLAISITAECGHINAITALAELGADVNSVFTHTGWTPVCAAATTSRADVA
jgi:hypothetical protein